MEKRSKVCINGPGHMKKMAAMPIYGKSNRKAMNRNWSNQKANPRKSREINITNRQNTKRTNC